LPQVRYAHFTTKTPAKNGGAIFGSPTRHPVEKLNRNRESIVPFLFVSEKNVIFLYKFLKNIFIGLCVIQEFYVYLRGN